MATQHNHKAMLRKLKNRVRMLQRKEEQAKNKLRAALKKMHKIGRSYKSKLSSKMRKMKGKIAQVQASTYAKAAANLERQMLNSIGTKAKALVAAATKIEKKHAVKLTKSIAKKGKKAAKRRVKR